MRIFGHRGASADAPENTLSAFRLAWEQGADGVELDIHLSKDRQVVVCHDADTRRTTGRRLIVANNRAARLQALDAGAWKGRAWVGERIPLLDQVVAALPDGKQLLVEIKCGAAIAGPLARMDLAAGVVGFLSFDERALAAVRRVLPEHACLLNVEAPGHRKGYDLAHWANVCHRRGFTGLSFGWHRSVCYAAVRQLHAQGLDVAVWNIRTPREARLAQEADVDVLIVDQPGLMRRKLARA